MLVDGTDHDMPRATDGWWRADVETAARGLRVPARRRRDPLPDPRSRWQPHGVHGPSRRYDHDGFAWTDAAWTGRTLPGSVLYELHIGTFTPDGTFDAAIERLDHLVELGIDLVEVLPVNAVDGPPAGATTASAGTRSRALRRPGRVQAVRRRLPRPRHRRRARRRLQPPRALGRLPRPLRAVLRRPERLGPALNLDGPDSDEVRRYVIDNALLWLRDFHVDGLRIDAVHALRDTRALHLLEQLAGEVDALCRRTLGAPCR